MRAQMWMGCCCGDRPSSDTVKGSGFDEKLLQGCARALEKSGIINTDPTRTLRRNSDGPLGLAVQFSGGQFTHRGTPQPAFQGVVAQAGPDSFNFMKVEQEEKVAVVEAVADGQGKRTRTTVLVDKCPIAFGHVLLVPHRELLLPQVLTEELVLCALVLLGMSNRRDFRLLFSSLMAGTTVNHFHLHGLYLEHCGLPGERLPLERVDRSVVAGGLTEGRVLIELLVESQWYTGGFVVSAGHRKGTADGQQPPGDIVALASVAWQIVRELQREGVAHNVLFAPPTVKRPKQHGPKLLAHEDVERLTAASPEVYILPRKAESCLRPGAGFSASALDLAGLLLAHTFEDYETFTEEVVSDIFSEDIALPSDSFNKLICKASWLAA